MTDAEHELYRQAFLAGWRACRRHLGEHSTDYAAAEAAEQALLMFGRANGLRQPGNGHGAKLPRVRK